MALSSSQSTSSASNRAAAHYRDCILVFPTLEDGGRCTKRQWRLHSGKTSPSVVSLNRSFALSHFAMLQQGRTGFRLVPGKAIDLVTLRKVSFDVLHLVALWVRRPPRCLMSRICVVAGKDIHTSPTGMLTMRSRKCATSDRNCQPGYGIKTSS